MTTFLLSVLGLGACLPREVQLPDAALHSASTAADWLRAHGFVDGKIRSVSSAKGRTVIQTSSATYSLERGPNKPAVETATERTDRKVEAIGPEGNYLTLAFYRADGNEWILVAESLYYIGDSNWASIGNTIRAFLVKGIQ
jgi:hypothetical protein